MTPFVNSNLTVEHCLHANNVVYKTICDILRKEDVENDDEVTYHAASIQLMEAYLWKGISVGRSDTNEGRTLKESHMYEKRPT
jgi:hypothetical protein